MRADHRDVRDDEVLRCEHLAVTRGSAPIIRDVSLCLAAGESVAVMGASGSGKTTLLNCILGFVRPTRGVLVVAGRDLTKASHKTILGLRRSSIGIIFQGGELLGQLTPQENILVPALLAGLPPKAAAERAQMLLGRLGVPERAATSMLSGGERQRVAIARALVTQPQLLVADEPTASLDTQTRDDVMAVLQALPQEAGCALLVVTHDPVVAALADRTHDLLDGSLTQREQT